MWRQYYKVTGVQQEIDRWCLSLNSPTSKPSSENHQTQMQRYQ
jgi:hypothetical protein